MEKTYQKFVVFPQMIAKTTFDVCSFLLKNYGEENIKWFLGGSYRFGYNNESSDLDFFVFHGKDSEEIGFCYYLLLNEFAVMHPRDMIDYPEKTRGFAHKKYNIHVILIESYTRWEALRQNHEVIEKYLEDNPQVLQFIIKMKELFNDGFSFKGKWFYRTLKKLCIDAKINSFKEFKLK